MKKEMATQSRFFTLIEVQDLQKPTLFGVKVGEGGHLIFDENETIPELCFDFQGIPFTTRFQKTDQGWQISLYGAFGCIPFSCEDMRARAFLLSFLWGLREKKDFSFKPEVTQDQHLVVVNHIYITERLTTIRVFSALVQALWEIAPTLALFEHRPRQCL